MKPGYILGHLYTDFNSMNKVVLKHNILQTATEALAIIARKGENFLQIIKHKEIFYYCYMTTSGLLKFRFNSLYIFNVSEHFKLFRPDADYFDHGRA